MKRTFGVCAGKEAAALGISGAQRKAGIPTLVVVDRVTGNIIDADGLEALRKSGPKAITKWLDACG